MGIPTEQTPDEGADRPRAGELLGRLSSPSGPTRAGGWWPRAGIALALAALTAGLAAVAPDAVWSTALQAVLAGVVALVVALPVHLAAGRAARSARATPAVLLSLGILLTYAAGLAGMGGTPAAGRPALWATGLVTALTLATAAWTGSLARAVPAPAVGAPHPARPTGWLGFAAGPAPEPGGDPNPPDRRNALVLAAVLGVALVALVVALATGSGAARALGIAAAVLLVTAPGAAFLLGPALRAAAVERGVPGGAQVRDAAALEEAQHVDTVVLGAPGTLTDGPPTLESIAVHGSLSKKAALTAAAAVVRGDRDPVARAISAGARLARLDPPLARERRSTLGDGAVTARIKDTEVTVGGADQFAAVDPTLLAHARTATGTTVFVGWDDTARAALTVSQPVREGVATDVAGLVEAGLTPVLLTSAEESSARALAESVGIPSSKVTPGVSAKDLSAAVGELDRPGGGTAFVCDEASLAADSPEAVSLRLALARADLGVVTGTESDGDRPTPDRPHVEVRLAGSSLTGLRETVSLARAVAARVRQGVIAIAAIGLAGVALAAAGILAPPVAAAVATATTGAAAALLRSGSTTSTAPTD